MTTPTYQQFPHKFVNTSGTTAINVAYSGILAGVVIQRSTNGTIEIVDANGRIALFGASTPAGSYAFWTDYAQPLNINCSVGSDYVTVMAGPV